VNGTPFLSPESIAELRTIRTENISMRFVPKSAQGFQYATGAWAIEQKNGVADVLSSIGMFGNWPVIDYCHGYASMVLTKNTLSEERADLHQQVRELIAARLPSICK
jgi:hypothetical protein